MLLSVVLTVFGSNIITRFKNPNGLTFIENRETSLGDYEASVMIVGYDPKNSYKCKERLQHELTPGLITFDVNSKILETQYYH